MTYKEAKLVCKTVIATLWALFMLWFLWSWYDVVAHQMSGGTDNPLNLIRIFINMAGGQV